jgi:hypothetical protein
VENELLAQSWYENDTGQVSLSFLTSEILAYRKKIMNKKTDPVLRIFFEAFFRHYLMIKDKYWSPMSRSDGEVLLKKYFKITDELYSNDYSKVMINLSPIYSLSKK